MNTNTMSQPEDLVCMPQPGSLNPPWRILVVDDDADIRLLNSEVLQGAGYEVDTAEDGEAAWLALDAVCGTLESYDLLITDHDMPQSSGLDLVKKLRAARMELPFILATGNLPTEELERKPWLQPAATLLKPYSIEGLVKTVREVKRATEVTRTRPKLPSKWSGQRSMADLQLYDFTSQPHAGQVELLSCDG